MEELLFIQTGFLLPLIASPTIAVFLKVVSLRQYGVSLSINSDTLLDIVVKVGKTTKDNFQYDAEERTYYADSIHCHNQNCKAQNSPRVNDVALIKLREPVEMKE